jgi:hypothetical protein
MHRPRDLSIRQKLQGIVMVTCAAAQAVTTVVFTFDDRATFLRAKTQDLIVSAERIGSDITTTLTFHDQGSVRETLTALQANRADSSLQAALFLRESGSAFFPLEPMECGGG